MREITQLHSPELAPWQEAAKAPLGRWCVPLETQRRWWDPTEPLRLCPPKGTGTGWAQGHQGGSQGAEMWQQPALESPAHPSVWPLGWGHLAERQQGKGEKHKKRERTVWRSSLVHGGTNIGRCFFGVSEVQNSCFVNSIMQDHDRKEH